jgi:hypothetical protein
MERSTTFFTAWTEAFWGWGGGLCRKFRDWCSFTWLPWVAGGEGTEEHTRDTSGLSHVLHLLDTQLSDLSTQASNLSRSA